MKGENMVICQIMIKDFMHGWGGLGKGYGKFDLEVGIQYCQDLINFDGLKKEPFHGYDLRKFIEWARGQLKKCGKVVQLEKSK
jgi:hypothetical protein